MTFSVTRIRYCERAEQVGWTPIRVFKRNEFILLETVVISLVCCKNPMAARNPTAASATILLILTISMLFCTDSPSGPEDDPPVIEILFPTSSTYDKDGDGLVDIEITFRDTGSGLDAQSLEIESNRPLGPSGTGGTNLLTSFVVIERDSLHIVLEETTESLLPSGEVELNVKLSDRAGNRIETTIRLDLPAGSFHRHMPSPTSDEFGQGMEIVPEGPDGQPIGFLLLRSELVPFDPRALSYGAPISTGGIVDPVDGEWDPATKRLYLVSVTTGDVIVLDPVTMQLEPPILIFARSTGISRSPSGLLYISCSTTPATFSVVDPLQRREVRFVQTSVIDPGQPGEPAFIHTPRIPNEEDRAYIPLNVVPGGLLVVDLITGNVIRNLDLNPDSHLGGIAVESVLDRDRGLLYVSELLTPGGLTVLDIDTETIIARITRPDFGGAFPALSPSGDRIFLTLANRTGGVPENWIIDTTTFELLARIPVPHTSFSGAHQVAFRPDGQLVFAVTGDGMSVYLNRE